MSFNLEKDGDKIAVINSDKRQKKLYFSESDDGKEEIVLKPNEQFMLSPDKTCERTTMYVCGSAGSGKSYFVAQFCEEYHKTFKSNPIYLISENDQDKAFDSKDYIKRIEISDMDSNPLDWKEFSDCLIIFDDIDSIKGKLGKTIDELRDKLLKNSRKFRVSVISTSHDACGIKLKSVLNESKIIVFFMMNYNRSLKYLLENYLGMSKHVIEKLKNSKSRWTAFCKAYPSYLIQQRHIITVPKLERT
jgi:hypothetical protein